MSEHAKVFRTRLTDRLLLPPQRQHQRTPRGSRTPPGTVDRELLARFADRELLARFADRLRTRPPRRPGKAAEMPKYEYRWVHDGDIVWTGSSRPLDMTPMEDDVMVCERRVVGPWTLVAPDDDDESGTMD